VHQPQAVDAAVQPAGDAAEAQHLGEAQQVQVVHRDVRAETGRGAERPLQRERRKCHAPVEHPQRETTVEIDTVVGVVHVRQVAVQPPLERWQAQRLRDLAEV
ncbi:hypothetical protein COK69_26870, partial [Bacillus cereus]